MGPLAGVRVLDLSRVLAGPWASQLLADLGADVVKVEAPGRGDDTRHWGPPELVAGEAAYFHAANRGKRSIALDLARDRETLLALVDRADVVIENFKVGGLARYGLDYPSLKARRPALIYCSITGFGQDGPWALRPGYDLLIQGLGGLMSITGQPDEAPGGGPVKVGVALVDILTGLYATIGIQAALRHQERTGEGQQIDLALLDVSVAVPRSATVGGLVVALLGRPARRGDVVHLDNVEMTVLAVWRNRVTEVMVRLTPETANAGDDEGENS